MSGHFSRGIMWYSKMNIHIFINTHRETDTDQSEWLYEFGYSCCTWIYITNIVVFVLKYSIAIIKISELWYGID